LIRKTNIYCHKKIFSRIEDSKYNTYKSVKLVSKISPQLKSVEFKLKYINPSDINYKSGLSPPRMYGFVCGGNWDLDVDCSGRPYGPKRDLEDFVPLEGIKQYIEYGEKDRLHNHFRKHIENENSRPWGYNSLDDFEDRLEEINNLFLSIKENGYLTQREIIQRESIEVSNNEPVPPELNEVTVDVGRN